MKQYFDRIWRQTVAKPLSVQDNRTECMMTVGVAGKWQRIGLVVSVLVETMHMFLVVEMDVHIGHRAQI